MDKLKRQGTRDRHDELAEKFRLLGIDTSSPGFYDDPKFIAAQANDAKPLEEYSEFVLTRPFNTAYLARARQVKTDPADFLYGRLAADGRLGACIDCSGGALRMLERDDIWCYTATGGGRLAFAEETGLPTLSVYPFTSEDSLTWAAHGWLGVPPFRILDMTISTR